MRLILIRHGQTQSNIDGLLDTGHPGAPLTQLGHQQAAALVDTLAAEDIGALYVSTLIRTHQTAAPLAAARGLTVIEREGLREIQAGDWEMSGDRDFNDVYRGMIGDWGLGRYHQPVPGAEVAHQVLARFDAVVEEALDSASQHGHSTVALVSHGAMIRFWATTTAANLQGDFTSQNLLPNTAHVTLEQSEGRWLARRWGDFGDLP